MEVVHRDEEAQTVVVPEALTELVADKQRDVVGLTEGLSVPDLEAVAQALTEFEAVQQTLPENVPEPVPLPLLHTEAL